MTLKTFVILAACVALGCLRASRRRGLGTGGRRRLRTEAAPHEEEENTVEVDEGMLRDLRITTRPVESRPGGERVVLLGELAVDQRAYAEVGTPVAARITSLLVNTGDSVRSGQALAELTSPELGRERAAYLSARARLTLADVGARAQACAGR